MHDLRGTFVTLSLANGRTETWVADRTGHKSSVMINDYRRQARTAAELRLGELSPMDEAIPELRREKVTERVTAPVEGADDVTYILGITGQSRAGGMAYAGDLKAPAAAANAPPDDENAHVSESAPDDARRDATAATRSDAPGARSTGPRIEVLEGLAHFVGTLAAAGDVAGVRVLERARAELLNDLLDSDDSDRDIKPGNVIDLASRRRPS